MKYMRSKIAGLLSGLLLVGSVAVFTGCDDDDDYDTNQYQGSTSLSATQLQVTRGGTMLFKGTGLGTGADIEFTGGAKGSNIVEVRDVNGKLDGIRCDVPDEALPGPVKVRCNGKEMTTAPIAFTEAFSFKEFSPLEVTPGEKLTVKGDYLNLVQYIVFDGVEARASLPAATTTRVYESGVEVPVTAKTGKVNLGQETKMSDGTVELNLVPCASDVALTVKEPTAAALKDAATPVKATFAKEGAQAPYNATEAFQEGDKVTITGDLLRLVEKVEFNHNEGVSADNATVVVNTLESAKTDQESLELPVPVYAAEGKLTLHLFNGNTLMVGTDKEIRDPNDGNGFGTTFIVENGLKLVAPVPTALDEATTFGEKDKVTIKGTNLDLVASFAYTTGKDAKGQPSSFGAGNVVNATGTTHRDAVKNDDGTEKEAAKDVADAGKLAGGDIELPGVPAAAWSGPIELTLHNGDKVRCEGFVTTKPTLSLPTDPVTPLDVLTLQGTLCKRIAAITFAGEATVDNGKGTSFKAEESSLLAEVPQTAEADKEGNAEVKVTMDNGEEVKIGSVQLKAMTFAYLVGHDFEKNTTMAGGMFICEVANPTKLTGVLFKGEPTQFVINNPKSKHPLLAVNVGERFGEYVVTLVSTDDGGTEHQVKYDIKILDASVVENVIFKGPIEPGEKVTLGGDAGIPVSAMDGLAKGAILRIYYMGVLNGWPAIDLSCCANRWWTYVLAGNNSLNLFNPWDASADFTQVMQFDHPLTADEVDKIKADGKLEVIANNIIVTKVTLVVDNSAPRNVVTFPNNTGGDNVTGWPIDLAAHPWGAGGQFSIDKNAAFDMKDLVHNGGKLYITYTGKGQLQFNNSSWQNGEGWPVFADWDGATEPTEAVYELTQTEIDAFDATDEGGTWIVLQGDGLQILSIGMK